VTLDFSVETDRNFMSYLIIIGDFDANPISFFFEKFCVHLFSPG